MQINILLFLNLAVDIASNSNFFRSFFQMVPCIPDVLLNPDLQVASSLASPNNNLQTAFACQWFVLYAHTNKQTMSIVVLCAHAKTE